MFLRSSLSLALYENTITNIISLFQDPITSSCQDTTTENSKLINYDTHDIGSKKSDIWLKKCTIQYTLLKVCNKRLFKKYQKHPFINIQTVK